MQKPLNTHSFFFLSLARERQAPHLAKKASLLTALVLLLSALSVSTAIAADFGSNLVFITGRKGGAAITPRTFYTNNPGSSGVTVPFTTSSPLGTFNRTDTVIDELYVNAESNTTAGNNETVAPPSLLYRVYRQDSPEQQGGFIPLQLTLVSGAPNGVAKWSSNLSNTVNLIQYASTPGDYFLEVYFQSTYTVAGVPSNPAFPNFFFDGSDAIPYKNSFVQNIDGQLFVQSTWAPKSSDWFDASNWADSKDPSKPGSVPNFNVDVVIPRNTTGAYPNIDGRRDARVHNLTLAGTSPSQKAGLSLTTGTLSISGNFQDSWGGFYQAEQSFLLLTGSETQVFDASSRPKVKPLSLFYLGLQGTGSKVMTSNMTITRSIIMNSNGIPSGNLVTGNFVVDLGTTGVLTGETSSGYIEGTVTSTRTVANQQANDFGGIGVRITANRDNTSATSPGLTTVTRSNYVYTGIGTSQSINRSFTFVPARANIPQFDLDFNYLDADLNGIKISDLRLFRSETGDIPFEPLGSSTSSVANTFTRNNISGNLAAVFTLGDNTNPLPVTLVSFTAAPTAQGNALLRWATANESNNKGFGIERQLASGDAWLPVGYLATGNNAKGGKYEYVDKSLSSATFTPQAYYRLRQEDLDGKVSYSPVAVVARQAVAASSNLVLSPVPVTGASISLTFAEAGQAGSEISIINTQGQRLYTYTTQASTDAALSLPVEGLAAGVYIVSVRVPGQALRHARFVKL